mgnify:CR=1 FL=1
MKIDLREQPTVKCEKCESVWFEEVTMIKKVSKLLTGGTEDTIVPFPTYSFPAEPREIPVSKADAPLVPE